MTDGLEVEVRQQQTWSYSSFPVAHYVEAAHQHIIRLWDLSLN